MKRILPALIGLLCLVPAGFPQGTIAYCYNDPDQSPNYFIYSIKPDGSDNHLLVSSDIGLNHCEWSPDGRKIACVGYQNFDASWSIYVFDSNGANLTRLTKREDVLDGALSWSPDGGKIAFTRSYPAFPDRAHEIWIMNADGTDQHFSGTYGFQPMWSSDGTKFVYCGIKSGNWEIYVSGIDGKNEQRITGNPASDMNPVWSPNGMQIAFMSERTGNPEIYIMQANGTRPVRLTDNPGYEGMPRWSPDGTRLTFNSAPAGSQQIDVYLINTDGTGLVRLTHSTGNTRSINPAWHPVQGTGIPDDGGFNIKGNILKQNYPNPFMHYTTIDFALENPEHVHLEITDLSGKRIRTLVDEFKGPGYYSKIWEATGENGELLPDGLYFYHLRGDRIFLKGKALLVRN
jgi:TolB protein